eukprot:TRINITY_DN78707_c0_g1_i1.p1 TRINITY_DN78707_c0_g1~~TRINITY_DN78707_c0_g1_i1.p1  ORF type:complete len:568 (-),score=111.01 TRINITY_DN78707_c0_g1_i1:66-1769(-)
MAKSTSLLLLGLLGGARAAQVDSEDYSANEDVLSTIAGAIQQKEAYTTNPMCLKNNCMNPVFPALEDMHGLESTTWYCTSLRETRTAMTFCKGAINYDTGIPKPTTPAEESIEALIRKQDRAANSAFVYHLAGMGKDAWEYSRPEQTEDPCVKQIYKMVCFTHFPRAKAGCKTGSEIPYFRPCKNACENYISACNVECCDDSTQCVFTHKKRLNKLATITQKGYVDEDGPSALCTGAAGRSSVPGLLTMLLLLLAFPMGPIQAVFSSVKRSLPGFKTMACLVVLVSMSLTMQGCESTMVIHRVANWRMETDFLVKYQFVPPGGSTKEAKLNSCSVVGLAPTMQCSGHGSCRPWTSTAKYNPTMFCECDRDWADPECRTPRKSQAYTFFLALVFGCVGADRFYLGLHISGTLKLLTQGGFLVNWITETLVTGEPPVGKRDLQSWLGLFKLAFFLCISSWYVVDIMRAGSAPLETPSFRCAPDLPRIVFITVTVSFAGLVGLTYAYITTVNELAARRKSIWLQWSEEEREAAALDEGVLSGGNRWAANDKSSYGSLESGALKGGGGIKF